MAEHRDAARVHQPPANVFALLRRNHEQQLCLDAGRALLLCGALVTIHTAFDSGPANANSPAATASATLVAFVGFILWILGACLCLLALMPEAPWAVRAGVAVASTVLKCLCPPVAVNY